MKHTHLCKRSKPDLEITLSPAEVVAVDKTLPDRHGCLCNDGRCERCNALVEAWEAMREVIDAAFGLIPGGKSHWTWAQTVEKARAALALAAKVKP